MADEPEDIPTEDDGADLVGEEAAPIEAKADAPVRNKGGRPKKVAEVVEAATEERLHPILSNEDFLAAQAAARKKIDKERRLAAMKAVESAESDRLRTEEGMTTGITEADELVDIQIDLPLYTPSITINRFPFMHGRSYRVPRHVYNTLKEQMWRAIRHDEQCEGKSLRETYARKRDTLLNGNTGAAINAPRAFDA